jgi:hypothetical protein
LFEKHRGYLPVYTTFIFSDKTMNNYWFELVADDDAEDVVSVLQCYVL